MYNVAKLNQRNTKECDKPNTHISSKLHTVCMYCDDDRHPFPNTEAQLLSRNTGTGY